MAHQVLMIEDEQGESLAIPAKFELCNQCEGSGSVDHPAFSNGITSSEWADMSGDEQETYMKGGYDVRCDCCSGRGTVLVVDPSRLTYQHRRALVVKRQWDRAKREVQNETHAERRAFGWS